jgi:hypothetical protein
MFKHEYEGKIYELEDWARFICRDEDGKIWQYDEPPIKSRDEWRLRSGRMACINDDLCSWEDSLVEIERDE